MGMYPNLKNIASGFPVGFAAGGRDWKVQPEMKKFLFPFFSVTGTLVFFISVQLFPREPQMPDQNSLQEMTARFAPVEISADIGPLPANERRALLKLLQAARIMDSLFLRQVWAGNESLLMSLTGDETPLGGARLRYFLINKGPWSRLDHNAAFIPGVPRKPAGANYYPAGASKKDVASWLERLSPEERTRAMGFYSTIRHDNESPAGPYTVVPYSMEYQPELALAADLLREAAALTVQPTLRDFLKKRADAFLSNDYYESDLAWMEIDSSIEPTIGPYEVYEDEWFNAKAAFEAFITIRDEAETDKLSKLAAHLQEIENNLPIDPKFRNPKLGTMAPIRVVNEILATGDANHGVQTAAFNLPNDERVIREKGAKRVMVKNVQEAKFRIVLIPIARAVLTGQDQKHVSFDAFFTHILMHELMHGLGPHDIHAGGEKTTVRRELKETYSAIEEAKADISGLFAFRFLAGMDVLDTELMDSVYQTYLASAFRSLRFGINEAHGRGMAIQLNYLIDFGAIRFNNDGTLALDAKKMHEGAQALTREIMHLQAEGSYSKARDLLDRLGILRPEVREVLDRLQHIPVDIEPVFTTAEKLLSENPE